MHFKIQKDFTLCSFDALCGSPVIEEAISGEAEKMAMFLAAQSNPCDIALLLESTMLRLILYFVNGKLYPANDENFHEIWQTFRMNADVMSKRWESFTGFRLWRHSSVYNMFQISERTELQYAYQRDIVNRYIYIHCKLIYCGSATSLDVNVLTSLCKRLRQRTGKNELVQLKKTPKIHKIIDIFWG